jgi:hypothetical protein
VEDRGDRVPHRPLPRCTRSCHAELDAAACTRGEMDEELSASQMDTLARVQEGAADQRVGRRSVAEGAILFHFFLFFSFLFSSVFFSFWFLIYIRIQTLYIWFFIFFRFFNTN